MSYHQHKNIFSIWFYQSFFHCLLNFIISFLLFFTTQFTSHEKFELCIDIFSNRNSILYHVITWVNIGFQHVTFFSQKKMGIDILCKQPFFFFGIKKRLIISVHQALTTFIRKSFINYYLNEKIIRIKKWPSFVRRKKREREREKERKKKKSIKDHNQPSTIWLLSYMKRHGIQPFNENSYKSYKMSKRIFTNNNRRFRWMTIQTISNQIFRVHNIFTIKYHRSGAVSRDIRALVQISLLSNFYYKHLSYSFLL